MSTNIFDELHADDVTLAQLHDRLEHDAASDGLLDVAYRTVDTPVGTLLVAATTVGVVRVAFDVENHDVVLTRLTESVSPRILRAPRRLDGVARQLDEYFGRRRTTFEVPIDLRLADGFRRSVIEHLRGIGYGTRESYAEVAAAVGNPRAVRAVGTACGHNPLPVVIPCHRVVRADGSTGQYVGGAAAKVALLELEAVDSDSGMKTRTRR